MTPFKRYIIIATITMAFAWLMGALRFNYEIAGVLFKVLLFPFGWIYTIIESQSVNDGLRNWMDDEVSQGTIFLLAVLLQAYIYFLILKLLNKNNK
jgi:hypothetical protein